MTPRLQELPAPDVVVANGAEVLVAPGASWARSAFAKRASHLGARVALVEIDELRAFIAGDADDRARDLSEQAGALFEHVPQLEPLLSAAGPHNLRVLPQVWSQSAFRLVEALRRLGIDVDPAWVPQVSATQLR